VFPRNGIGRNQKHRVISHSRRSLDTGRDEIGKYKICKKKGDDNRKREGESLAVGRDEKTKTLVWSSGYFKRTHNNGGAGGKKKKANAVS